MFHVDTLSRAYQTENLGDFVHSLEAIDATLGLPVSANRLQQIQHATAEDPGVSLLSDVIKGDWPEEKHSAWPALRAYQDAQRLMGRMCKTLLPMATSLLQHQHSIAHDRQVIVVAKTKQGWYYNRHTNPLTKLKSGEGIRIHLHGEKSWTSGICEGSAGP